jgi:ppGpp synthetase/RelA/SpoT-type nucleotidyltranferase
MYILLLRKSSKRNLLVLPYANKLLDAQAMLAPENFKNFYEDDKENKEANRNTFIGNLCAFLSNWSIKEKTPLTLTWRVKTYRSYNKKIREFLIKDEPLSKILDLIGLRVIVGKKPIDDSSSIRLCYKLANDLQHWLMLEMESTLMDSEPRKSPDITILNDDVEEDIWIPDKSLIPRSFQNNWKDYIAFPKSNGYQGLHLVFRLSYPVFLEMELQIRSHAMHERAEHGSCAHSSHKKNRYPTVFNDLMDPSIDDIPQSIPTKGSKEFHP